MQKSQNWYLGKLLWQKQKGNCLCEVHSSRFTLHQFVHSVVKHFFAALSFDIRKLTNTNPKQQNFRAPSLSFSFCRCIHSVLNNFGGLTFVDQNSLHCHNHCYSSFETVSHSNNPKNYTEAVFVAVVNWCCSVDFINFSWNC